MIRAVLFDMDGVLIDAKDWHYEALNRALDLFGLAIDRESHLSTYDGLPTRRKLEMLSKTKALPRSLHDFLNDLKQQYTVEIAGARCKPTFNHQNALARLKLANYKIAVCSNSVRNSVKLMMDLAKLSANLDLIVSNEDVSRPKPDPEMYNKAINFFGLHPRECLILEDNDHGIAAARASGAHVMVVPDPSFVVYETIADKIKSIDSIK